MKQIILAMSLTSVHANLASAATDSTKPPLGELVLSQCTLTSLNQALNSFLKVNEILGARVVSTNKGGGSPTPGLDIQKLLNGGQVSLQLADGRKMNWFPYVSFKNVINGPAFA